MRTAGPQASKQRATESCLLLRIHLDDADAITRIPRNLTGNVLRLEPNTMSHREHDRGDDRQEQQHSREFEGIQVFGIEQLTEHACIAVISRVRYCSSSLRDAKMLNPHHAADFDDHECG